MKKKFIGPTTDEPSTENKTGTWRTFRPIIDNAKCIGCGMCEEVCPDSCVHVINKKAVIDYDFCKGCLICLNQCPVKAIKKDIEK
jgi:2-oxoacid:acceptor oxidoreductase delta subunit (pyruvate/2-ketoisovalerate family)